jgi:hypothetical protein
MHKSRALVAATLLTLLTAASSFADARKPFAGICEGVVQLGFFIDGAVSVPTGKTQRKKSIGRLMALMRGGFCGFLASHGFPDTSAQTLPSRCLGRSNKRAASANS